MLERYLRTPRRSDHWLFRRREALTTELIDNHLDSESPAEPLVELDGSTCTVDEFLRASHNYCRPVVLRNFARDTAAVQKWTPEYLKGIVGDYPVRLYEQPEEGAGDGFTTLSHHQMPFDEFVDTLVEVPLYLHNSTELFVDFPELFNDLGVGTIDARFSRETKATNLFVGSHRVFSPLHSALDGNFFLNIAGRKQWRLIAPQHRDYLLPLFSKPFVYMLTPWTYKTAPKDHHLWRVPYHEFVLEPGDGLYNPPWWWHEVINHGDFVVGYAIRHRARGWTRPFSSENWKNSPMCTAMSMLPLMEAHYWGHKARQLVIGSDEPYAASFNRLTESIARDGVSFMNRDQPQQSEPSESR